MNRLRIIFESLPAYLAASSLGRRYLRDLHKSSRGKKNGPSADYLNDRWQRSLLMRNFSICDLCFRRWVPNGICGASGTDRFRIYLRLIPFAWIGQAIRTRLLEAFALGYDRAAEERSIIQSFVHREWNDLKDLYGITFQDLYSILEPGKLPRPEMSLYSFFSERLIRMTPPERFLNYYRMIRDAPRVISRQATRETAARVTAENAHFSMQLAFYIMHDTLPEALMDILPAFGLWLYSLDEYSDLEQDLKTGRTTFMSSVAEPEKELDRVYAEMVKQVSAAAPHPRRLLDYLDILYRDVLRLKQRGIDIESRLFHVD